MSRAARTRTSLVRPVALVLGALLVGTIGGSAVAGPSHARVVATAVSETVAVLADREQAAEQARRAQQALHGQQALQAQRAWQAQARRAAALRAAALRAATLRAATLRAAAATARRVPARVAAVQPVTVVRTATRTVRRTETAVQRGTRVLAALHYPWQQLGYRIEFLPGKNGYLGLTDGGKKLVTIYVRSSESDLVLSHSIAHELGHVLDFTRGSGAKHSQYLSIRGLSPDLAWYGCSGCTDYRTPAGDWAEVFACWLAGPGDFRSQLGPAPSGSQLSNLGALFAL